MEDMYKEDVYSVLGEENSTFLNDYKDLKFPAVVVSDEETIEEGEVSVLGEEVDLYKELVKLFDPDNFDCGCQGRLKKAIKKIKPKNKDVEGFVPKVVQKNALIADKVLLLEKSAGTNVLAHLFQYKANGGQISKYLFARNSSSVESFDSKKYLETNPQAYPHFCYTLDCTGFVAAAVNATAGVSAASVKTSASVAVNSEKSLFVLGGLIYSPLYLAFKGQKHFATDTVARIDALKAVLAEIPADDRSGDTEVFLNANYHVLFASNSGKSSFNGEGNLSGAGNASFGFGSVGGQVDGSGSMKRESSYTKYNTYIIDKNIQVIPETLTVGGIDSLIQSLQGS